MIEPLKSLDEQIIASSREMGISRIRHGLATTGVSDRIVHHATEILEQLRGGNCYVWEKLIDMTRDEYPCFFMKYDPD